MLGVIFFYFGWPLFLNYVEMPFEDPFLDSMKMNAHVFGYFLSDAFFGYSKSCISFTWIGVDGWGLPILGKVVQMGTAAWPLEKRDLYSASAAGAMIFQSILYKTMIKPLRTGVYLVKVVVLGLGFLSK